MIIVKNVGVGWKTKTGVYIPIKKPGHFNRLILTENPAKKAIMTDPVSRSIQKDIPDFIADAQVDEVEVSKL